MPDKKVEISNVFDSYLIKIALGMTGLTALIPSLAYLIYDVSPGNIVTILVVCAILFFSLPLGIWLWWYFWFKRKSGHLLDASTKLLLLHAKRWTWVLVGVTVLCISLIWFREDENLSYLICGLHLTFLLGLFFWVKKTGIKHDKKILLYLLFTSLLVGFVAQYLIVQQDRNYPYEIVPYDQINELVASEIQLQREIGKDNAPLLRRFQVLGTIEKLEAHGDTSAPLSDTLHANQMHSGHVHSTKDPTEFVALIQKIDSLKFLYAGSFEAADSVPNMTKNMDTLRNFVQRIAAAFEHITSHYDTLENYQEMYENHYLPFFKLSTQYAEEGSHKASKVVNTLLHRMRNVGVSIYVMMFTLFASLFFLLKVEMVSLENATPESLIAEATAAPEEPILDPKEKALAGVKAQVRLGMIVVFLLMIPMFNNSLGIEADFGEPSSMFSLQPVPGADFKPVATIENDMKDGDEEPDSKAEIEALKREIKNLGISIRKLSLSIGALDNTGPVINEIHRVEGANNIRLNQIDTVLGIKKKRVP